MDYETGKKWLEEALFEKCPDCDGTGEQDNSTPATGWPCRTCRGAGRQLNGLGDALVEILGDALEHKFAEKDHGHSFSGRD